MKKKVVYLLIVMGILFLMPLEGVALDSLKFDDADSLEVTLQKIETHLKSIQSYEDFKISLRQNLKNDLAEEFIQYCEKNCSKNRNYTLELKGTVFTYRAPEHKPVHLMVKDEAQEITFYLNQHRLDFKNYKSVKSQMEYLQRVMALKNEQSGYKNPLIEFLFMNGAVADSKSSGIMAGVWQTMRLTLSGTEGAERLSDAITTFKKKNKLNGAPQAQVTCESGGVNAVSKVKVRMRYPYATTHENLEFQLSTEQKNSYTTIPYEDLNVNVQVKQWMEDSVDGIQGIIQVPLKNGSFGQARVISSKDSFFKSSLTRIKEAESALKAAYLCCATDRRGDKHCQQTFNQQIVNQKINSAPPPPDTGPTIPGQK